MSQHTALMVAAGLALAMFGFEILSKNKRWGKAFERSFFMAIAVVAFVLVSHYKHIDNGLALKLAAALALGLYGFEVIAKKSRWGKAFERSFFAAIAVATCLLVTTS